MGHTNSTTNYGLPQFLTSDKPAWLTDVNNAMSDIDSAIYAAQSKADTAYNDAGTAQGDATTALTNAAAADAKGSGALASIEVAFDPTSVYSVGAKVIYNSLLYRCIVAVTTPGAWTGSANWERITVDNIISTVDNKIGSLSSLATTDKSSTVNAINEVVGTVGYTTGQSGNFTYRKWNDGTLEVWGTRNRTNLTITFNAFGSIYYYEIGGLGTYPIAFTRIDSIQAIGNIGDNGQCFSGVAHNISLSSAPAISIFRGASFSGTCDLNEWMYVKGTWN